MTPRAKQVVLNHGERPLTKVGMSLKLFTDDPEQRISGRRKPQKQAC